MTIQRVLFNDPAHQVLEKEIYAWAASQMEPAGNQMRHGNLHLKWAQAQYLGLLEFYRQIGRIGC